MSEDLEIITGTKTEQYESLLPQVRALLDGGVALRQAQGLELAETAPQSSRHRGMAMLLRRALLPTCRDQNFARPFYL
jgi:hypothetical protein